MKQHLVVKMKLSVFRDDKSNWWICRGQCYCYHGGIFDTGEYENKTDEGTRLMIMWMMMRGVVGGTADDVGQQAHDPSTATSQYIHIYAPQYIYMFRSTPQYTYTCSTVHTYMLHSTPQCTHNAPQYQLLRKHTSDVSGGSYCIFYTSPIFPAAPQDPE